MTGVWKQLRCDLAELQRWTRKRWPNPVLVATAAAARVSHGEVPQYVSSNADWQHDTYISTVSEQSWQLEHVVAAAFSLVQVMTRYARQFSGQPLLVRVSLDQSGAASVTPASGTAVAFVDDNRVVALDVMRTQAATITLALRDWLGGKAIPAELLVAEDVAPIAVVCCNVLPRWQLRHVHRMAWSTSGGPYIGVGFSGAGVAVSTCHFAIDGYPHAAIAASVGAAVESVRPTREAQALLPPGAEIFAFAGFVPLATGVCVLPHPAPRVAEIAFAVGQALRQRYRIEQFTMQVPVALIRADAPSGRSVPALVVVDGDNKSQFIAATNAAIDQVRSGRSLMQGLMNFAATLPLPARWKRSSIATPSRFWQLSGLRAALGGRACVSMLRLAVDDCSYRHGLAAVSAPALAAIEGDPIGSVVATIVVTRESSLLTISSSGVIASDDAARALANEIAERLTVPV